MQQNECFMWNNKKKLEIKKVRELTAEDGKDNEQIENRASKPKYVWKPKKPTNEILLELKV